MERSRGSELPLPPVVGGGSGAGKGGDQAMAARPAS